MTIRPALAVYHGLPSLQGEGLILSGELIQHAGTAGEEGTHPLPDRKHYMMQESEAFNELLRRADQGEVPPLHNRTNVSPTLAFSRLCP